MATGIDNGNFGFVIVGSREFGVGVGMSMSIAYL